MKPVLVAGSVLALAGLLTTGCSSPNAQFVSLATTPSRPATQPESIALFSQGKAPACDYYVVGSVVGQGGNFVFGKAVATDQLRQAIAARGLDGGIEYHCAGPNSKDAGIGYCTAKAYVCRQVASSPPVPSR
jgi:hypothetical protein